MSTSQLQLLQLQVLLKLNNSKTSSQNSDILIKIMYFIDSWELVRYVPQGSTWHPATDQLNGTQAYGTFGDLSQAFSKTWTTNFNEVRLIFCIIVSRDSDLTTSVVRP